MCLTKLKTGLFSVNLTLNLISLALPFGHGRMVINTRFIEGAARGTN